MKASPLSGNIHFKEGFDAKSFDKTLNLISTYFFGEHEFSGSIQFKGRPTLYGLSCAEICQKADEGIADIQQLSYSISDAEHKAVSVRLQFFAGSIQAQAYYLAATGDKKENKWIQALLLGEIQEVTEEDRNKNKEEPAEKVNVSKSIPLPLKTIELELPPELPIDQLVNTLYDIFIQYMDKAEIDIRILTHTNDLVLGIQIDQLRQTLERKEGEIKQLEVVFDQLPAAYLKSKFLFSNSDPTICELQLNHSSTLNIEQLFRQLKEPVAAPRQKAASAQIPVQEEIVAHKAPPKPIYSKKKKILFVLPPECKHSMYFWRRLQGEFQYSKHKIAKVGSVFETGRTQKIIAGIKEADIIVIDLTERSSDCFFVLGLCVAQGKKPLLLDSGRSDIPSDFSQFPHKIYLASRDGIKLIATEVHQILS